jgi:ABC-type phosphate transport system substrate-binding protein
MLVLNRPKPRRKHALFTALAAFVSSVCALGVTAGSAAALGEQCSGANARGMGAFLQAQAQEQWSSDGEKGFSRSLNPLACSGVQGSGGTPEVTYVPLASPAALRHWGGEDGALHDKEFGFLARFLGTDIAPAGPVTEEGTVLASMKAALGSDVVVVPVTQTSIAIAANPPALPAHPACVVPRITAAQLQKVFSGEIKNWRQLGAASDPTLGGDCDQAITRIVRDESAGTTYQFKHYLSSVDSSALPCTGKSQRTWAQLQAPFGGESPPNTEWPRNADCQEGEGPVTTVSGSFGEGEISPLSYVKEHPGTITYGSLPEAERWASGQIINVYNGVKFADPATKESEANCDAAKYALPSGAAGGINVDWSQVYGSNPKIGEVAKNAYPICTLTWGIAAADRFSEGVATTVRDYLTFVIEQEGGQAAVRHRWYQDLPGPVAKAAAAAISHVNGKEEEEKEEGTGTVLCRAEPKLEEGVLTCPPEEGFSGKIEGTLMPKTVATFESASGSELTIACSEAHYTGEFNEDGTSTGSGISSFGFGLKEGCTTTFPEEPEAVVSFENPPYDASQFIYLNPLPWQGVFELAKAKGVPLLRIQSGPVCVYVQEFLQGQVTNGSTTQMSLEGKWKLGEEAPEGACPTLLRSSASLTVTGEGLPLYIAGK